MKTFIFGARALQNFSSAIEEGFKGLPKPDFEIWQVHASPDSLKEDLELLSRAKISNSKKIFLIHRPDELLFYPELRDFFGRNPRLPLVFLGDLVLEIPFWQERKSHISVIPHPFLDVTFPASEKYVIGSFTSWGEMRQLDHYLKLVDVLNDDFVFKVGGTIFGRPLTPKDLPSHVVLSQHLFIPHFNVQLYHLKGKKRLGESSGSLHRGISLPVIFEANGIERIEGLKVIKIRADDDLSKIDYQKAAADIVEMARDMKAHLEFNHAVALRNRPQHFAKAICSIILPRMVEPIL